MSNLTHTQNLFLQTHGGIVLWKALDGGGVTHYAYIKANKEQIIQMNLAYKDGRSISFEGFGEVILQGVGQIPSRKHQKHMVEQYGFKHS